MRDFSDEMQQMRDLAAKTKEGSLDNQKNKNKNCQFNFAPLAFWAREIPLLDHANFVDLKGRKDCLLLLLLDCVL